MSYYGDGSSVLTGSAVPFATLEGKSLSVWFKTSSLSLNEGIVGLRNATTGDYYSLHFLGTGGGDPIQFRRRDVSLADSTANGPGSVIALNTWHHILVVIGSGGNSVTVYVDGTAGTPDTNTVTPDAMDTYEIFDTGGASNSAQHTCEPAWYDAELTATDATDLYGAGVGGKNPQDFASVTDYSPMEDDLLADVGSITFSATGTITQDADHPAVNAPSGGGGAVTVTDVDTDEILVNGQLNVVTTGTNFEAVIGTGSMRLTDGAITSNFTIDSWSDTSIQGDLVQGNVPFTSAGNSVSVEVTNDSASSNTLGITFNPETDTAVVELASPLEGDGYIDIIGTPATGDQYHYASILYESDGVTPTVYTVSISATGFITIGNSPADGTYKFPVRYWDQSTWDEASLATGAEQTVIITGGAASSGIVSSIVGDITNDIVKSIVR